MSEPQEEDLFSIPRADGTYLLYAPLRRWVAVVNGAVVESVARARGDNGTTSPPGDVATLSALRAAGLFDGAAPDPPGVPEGYEFCPHEVTLFLTSRCNLRCRYCYADAGLKNVEMPWETARAAIDLVAANAGLLGSSKFGVGFHGGGEPSVAWGLLTRCVEHAEAKAEATGLDCEIYAATNGLLSPAKREYILQHFATVNVSLDGPQDIQDYNRPRTDGSGSYGDVAETLHFFDEHELRYSLRATVTAGTVHRMTEIVERLSEAFRFDSIQLEPAWLCGRCLTTGETPPEDARFVEEYLRAADRGRELGIAVSYSGARVDTLTSRFCAAPGDGFSVLPEGVATSCFEITDLDDPRAAIFHYGGFDTSSGSFRFDAERLRALRTLSVEGLPFCGDCFCKWHCAGDCLAKALERSGTNVHAGSPRCGINRSLMRAELERIVENPPPAVAPDAAGG